MNTNASSLPLDSEHLGIYVHFPWCLVKCPYCDFHSIAVEKKNGQVPTAFEARKQLPHARYADAVIQEYRTRLNEFDVAKYQVGSLFFGGGTPSLWEPEELARVLKVIREETPRVADDLEISVECNPSSVDEKFFERLLKAGVNRVSIGVQSLDKSRLQFLGREHDQHQGLLAIKAAFKAGFSRVSADLIYGVYQQSPKEACADLARILEYPLTHLSAYTLTIEPGTRFGALDRVGKLPLLSEDEVAKSFDEVSNYLRKAGFEHYEISNFSRAHQVSRHNLGYWLARPYLGLGTGAYGRIDSIRYRNGLSAERYLQTFAPEATNDGVKDYSSRKTLKFSNCTEEILQAQELQNELIMLGLRTRYGVNPSALAVDPNFLSQLIKKDELEYSPQRRLRIPRAQWLISDSIVTKLMHDTASMES